MNPTGLPRPSGSGSALAVRVSGKGDGVKEDNAYRKPVSLRAEHRRAPMHRCYGGNLVVGPGRRAWAGEGHCCRTTAAWTP